MSATRTSLLISFAEKYTLMVIGMGTSMAIARLLTPAQIGIFSIGAVVVGITQLVRDFGVGQYLIQERELTSAKVRAAFTLTLLIAWVMAALLVAASGAIGRFYDEPDVGSVLRVLAISCLLIPFGSVTLPLLRRELKFGALYCINVASGVASLVVSVGLALAGYGFLSLAWGAVASTAASVLASLCFRPRGMPWRPGWRGMRQLLSFGAYANSSNVLDEVGVAAPDLVIGKVLGAEAVGLFSKALGVLGIFNVLITKAVMPVVLPLFSAQARDGHDMKEPYLRTIRFMVALSWPFFGVLCVLALPLVRLLYGPQWDASVPLVRIMCLSWAVFSLFALARDLFVAMGHVKKRAQLEMVAVPVRIAGLLVAAPFGLEAVAWSIVLTQLFKAWLIYRGLAALTGMRVAELLSAVSKGTVLTLLSIAAPLLVMATMDLRGLALAPLALAASGAAAAWLAGVFLINHEIAHEISAVARQLSQQWRGRAVPR
ncbi:MAG TPA: lipopolysaccharide biosynthesis protein [Telluria sp.]